MSIPNKGKQWLQRVLLVPWQVVAEFLLARARLVADAGWTRLGRAAHQVLKSRHLARADNVGIAILRRLSEMMLQPFWLVTFECLARSFTERCQVRQSFVLKFPFLVEQRLARLP